MATTADWVKACATAVRQALAEDGFESVRFQKTASADRLSQVQRSKTAAVLKQIYDAAESGTSDDADRDAALTEIGVSLGLPAPVDFVTVSKSASNQAYLQLVNQISILINGVKK